MANLLLIHSDDADGSTAFVDAANGETITPNGDVQHSTAQAKFGASSLYFDGAGDWLTLPKIMPYGQPFTFDCWVYPTGYSGDFVSPLLSENSGSAEQLLYIRLATTPKGALSRYRQASFSGAEFWLTSPNIVPLAQWTHVAFVFDGSRQYLFINGNLEIDAADTYGWMSGAAALEIGRDVVPGYETRYFQGYLDEIRIADSAVWTQSFTPPTAPYDQVPVTGNGDWRAGLTVSLAGQNLSDRLVDRFEWSAERNAARIGTLRLQPAAGTYDPADWTGKPISISATMDGATKRRFTGYTRKPRYDAGTNTLTLELTDRLQHRYRAMSQSAIEAELAGSRWHDAIHGEPGDGWDIAQRLLETVTYSASLGHDGAFRYRPWAVGTPDASRIFADGHGYADVPIEIEAADEEARINLCSLQFQARAAIRHHVELDMVWGGTSFCDWADIIFATPVAENFESTANSNGYVVQQKGQFLSAGSGSGITYEGFPTEGGDLCSDGNLWVMGADQPNVLSASWTAVRRWQQRAEASYQVLMRAPDSQAAFTDGIDEDSASLDSNAGEDAWDNNTGTATPSEAGWAQAANASPKVRHYYSVDLDTADASNAIACFLAIKRTAILESHLWGITFADLPREVWDLDIGDTVDLDAVVNGRGLRTSARIEAISEYWDLDSGDAQTTLSLAPSVCPGAGGTDTALDNPVLPDFTPGYEFPAPPNLNTYIGGQEDSPPQSESWRGWITNTSAVTVKREDPDNPGSYIEQTLSNRDPGAEVYDPERGKLAVEYPDVPADGRENDATASLTPEYLVYPPNEPLEILIP